MLYSGVPFPTSWCIHSRTAASDSGSILLHPSTATAPTPEIIPNSPSAFFSSGSDINPASFDRRRAPRNLISCSADRKWPGVCSTSCISDACIIRFASPGLSVSGAAAFPTSYVVPPSLACCSASTAAACSAFTSACLVSVACNSSVARSARFCNASLSAGSVSFSASF